MKVKDIQFYLDNVYYADGIKEDIIQTYIDKEQYENTLFNIIKSLLLNARESDSADYAIVWFLSCLYRENKEVFKKMLRLFYETQDTQLLSDLLRELIFADNINFHEETIVLIMQFCVHSTDKHSILRVLTNLEILNDPDLTYQILNNIPFESPSLTRRSQKLLEKKDV
jgi:hypothetical protein